MLSMLSEYRHMRRLQPHQRFRALSAFAAAIPAANHKRTCNVRSCLNTRAEAFATLSSATPVCQLELSTQGSIRGLVASTAIRAGETALCIPRSISLCVPQRLTSVYRWECDHLEPYEAVHGPLPDALVLLLSDQGCSPFIRLAAWLLYLRKHGNALWQSWISLLPPLSAATYAGGFWTHEELQQLQFGHYMAYMEQFDHNSRIACEQFKDLLQEAEGLQELNLYSDTSDLLWALFIVVTRSFDSTMLHPVQDCINHSDDPNCEPVCKSDGTIIRALHSIKQGEEITIQYAPLQAANLQMLGSWGFTTSTRPLDMALPVTYHALPCISWVVAVSAIAMVAGRQQPQQGRCTGAAHNGNLHSASSDNTGDDCQQQAEPQSAQCLAITACSNENNYSVCADMLSGVVINLPLQHANSTMYAAAAQHLQRWRHDIHPGGLNVPRPLQDWRLTSLYIHPDPEGMAPVQASCVRAVQTRLQQARQADISCYAGDASAVAWWAQDCCAGLSLQELQLQQLVVTALHRECQMQLLQSPTTADQDQLLLQQQHLQQQQGASQVPAAAAASAIDEAVAAVSKQHLATSSANSRQSNVLLKQLQQLQQQIVTHLMLHRACNSALAAGSGSCSPVGSTTQQQAARIAKQLLQQLGEHQHALNPTSGLINMEQVEQLQVQQQQLLQQLQQAMALLPQHNEALLLQENHQASGPLQQQKRQQPPQQVAVSLHNQQAAEDMQENQQALFLLLLLQQQQATMPLLKWTSKVQHQHRLSPAATAVAQNASISKARLAAAVTARLEHKRLLMVLSDVLQAAQQILAAVMDRRLQSS